MSPSNVLGKQFVLSYSRNPVFSALARRMGGFLFGDSMARKFKKQPIPQNLRERVFRRDKYTCRYCGNKTENPHADHVYPESKGGETSIRNLVTACPDCNHRKHARIGVWPKTIKIVEKEVIVEKRPIYTELLFGTTVCLFLLYRISNLETILYLTMAFSALTIASIFILVSVKR